MKTGIGAIVGLAVTMSGIPLLALESMTLPGGTLYISMLPAGNRQVPR